jgi:uncharacterized repeat protein (TIGR01451 family)
MGTGPFVGSFTARISTIPGLTPSGPTLRRHNGQPVSTCTVSPEGIDCASGSIVLSDTFLGTRYVSADMTYAIPADFARDQVEICLELTEVDGQDATTGNNRNCRRLVILDPPQALAAEKKTGGDLAVSKRLLGACAKAGDECRYRVRVSNEGAVPLESEIVIDDALSPASGTFVSASAPGWTAEADGDGKAMLTLAATSLEPGQSKAIDVTFKVNNDASGDVENCATARKLPGDPNNSNDKACVTVTLDEDDTTEPPPPPPPSAELDLSLQLSGDTSCSTGQACRGQVTLTNVGSESFAGPLSVAHSFTGGRSAQVRYSGGGSGFTCIGPNFDRAQCTVSSLSLAPGSSARYPINFTPNRAADGTYQNCAEIKWTRDSGEGIAQAQAKLNELGFNAGKADGKAGPRTRAALRAYQRDNGLAETGQLDDATSARLLGPAKTFDDVDTGNDRACLSTTLRVTCTGGRIWGGSSCVCPRGLSFIRGKCRTPPKTCSPDKILVNGKCVCPRGKRLVNGVCQTAACPHQGQYRDRSGNCRCPSGQSVINGVCKRPVTACTADKILVNGQCVCRKGWVNRGGICQPPIVKNCPYPGQYRDRSGKCRCPSGQEIIGGSCKKPPTACIAQACPYGGQTRGRDCKCRCPSGQKVYEGRCIKPPGSGGGSKACRYKGQYRDRAGRCRCPSGQQVIRGACRKPSAAIPSDIKKKIPCNDSLRRLGVC